VIINNYILMKESLEEFRNPLFGLKF